jgi:EpsI family protein
MVFFLAGLALLVLAPIGTAHVRAGEQTSIGEPLPALPQCGSPSSWTGPWMPSFVEPDYVVAATYECPGARLHVALVQYLSQQQGREAVSEFNRVIPREWWNRTARARRSLRSGITVDEYRVDLSPVELTVLNWYAVDDVATTSEFETKLLEAFNVLRWRASATSNLTVAVETSDEVGARQLLATQADTIWRWFVSEIRR